MAIRGGSFAVRAFAFLIIPINHNNTFIIKGLTGSVPAVSYFALQNMYNMAELALLTLSSLCRMIIR
jgi:hypothetical protein